MDDAIRRGGIDRRDVIRGGAAASLALAATGARASIGRTKNHDNPAAAAGGVLATPPDLVVESDTGKLRGYISRGIVTFKGIPYGAPVAGGGRFQPATRAQPWTGVKPCFLYGATAPQITARRPSDFAFVSPSQYSFQDEDCLSLNVWTPGVVGGASGGHRPVMVWLHGGNFSSGSAHELLTTQGEALARRGDVVVVSVNHRLGLFGYLDLVSIGASPRFASAVNLGMEDIVLALRWVQQNIAAFGGDPGNVTIFGQSGGGLKVTALNAMPSARGLFHRAIVQSGSADRLFTQDMTAPLAAGLLQELQLSVAQADKLIDMPVDVLLAAGAKVTDRFGAAGAADIWKTVGWAPRPDGAIIPHQPYAAESLAMFQDVPLMLGCTLHEVSPSLNNPALEDMTMAGLRQYIAPRFRDPAKVAAGFAAVYPDQKPVALAGIISTAGFNRPNAIAQAQAKAGGRGAPAWLYRFAWEPEILDGRPRSYHCSDLPMAFYNIESVPGATGGTSRAWAMAARMSDTWIAFARNGNPNHPGIPHWPQVSTASAPTMVFNDDCLVQNGADEALLGLIAEERSAPDAKI
jgi:para-nitrobenzyl esterase